MKGGTVTNSVGFDHVLSDGREVCIEFDRVTTSSYDPSYGADADGRRGVPMWFIDDDRAEHVTVQFEGDPAPADAKTLTPETRVEIDEAIEQYLDGHEPEDNTRDDEPDYYDETDDDDEDPWEGE